MQNYFIGRQPILDANRMLFAYEILYRDSFDNIACVKNDKYATSKTLLNLFEKFGIENIIGESQGFLNLNDKYILSDAIELIPPDRFIIEILEYSKVNQELIERIYYLKQKGYIFALDDFTYKESYQKFSLLFNSVEYIKVDVRLADKKEIENKIGIFKKISHKLIAEKVETHEEFEFFKSLGFRYFQGFFFAKPLVFKKEDLDPNKIGIIKVVSALNRNDSLEKVVELLKLMPDVLVRLIKIINSVSFGLKTKINSIEQVVRMLGYNKLKIWLVLAIYTENTNVKKSPIFQTAILRGKLLEILSKKLQTKNTSFDDEFFVGILSMIDVIFQKPKEELLNQLNIDETIKKAVLEKTGLMGLLLRAIEFDEANNQAELLKILSNLNIDIDDFLNAKLESYVWVKNLVSEI